MIELIDFSKDYYNFSHKKSLFTVQPINLTLEKGTITGLLGANGSGKSTIIKAICGFHYPTSGKILISDNDGNKIDVSENPECAKKLIGYVPEQSILPPEMTVYEFLKFSAELHGIQKEKINDSLIKVIELCSLEKVLEKRIKKLSKGYGQRVSFAQAIIHNPPNLVLDEPVSGLDPSQIIQMRDLIKELAKDKTVLMSSHILQEVTALCGKISIISEGKLQITGSEEEIIKETNSKSLEDAFIKLAKGVE